MNARKHTILVLKIAFGTGYFFIFGEFFLRILDPTVLMPRYVCATPYGIRVNEPNRSFWHTTPEYRVHLQTNSKGLRSDREIPYEKPEGLKRVLVLGDSFGIGYGANFDEMFTSRMREALEREGITCEVVNLSVSGHGTAEQLILFQEEGVRYQPDLVMVAWTGSDPSDNTRSNLFGLEDGKLVRRSKEYLPGVKTREFLFQFATYRFIAGHSHLYCLFRERAAHTVKYKALPMLRRMSRADQPKPNASSNPKPRAGNYSTDLSLALLDELKARSEAVGAEFLILDIPHRSGRTKFYPTFLVRPEQAKGRFAVFCPAELFRQQNGAKLYWERSAGHFTPLGCRIVGEGLANFILEKRLLSDTIRQ